MDSITNSHEHNWSSFPSLSQNQYQYINGGGFNVLRSAEIVKDEEEEEEEEEEQEEEEEGAHEAEGSGDEDDTMLGYGDHGYSDIKNHEEKRSNVLMQHGSFTAQMLEIASMSPHHQIERRHSTHHHHNHQYNPMNDHHHHHHRNSIAGHDCLNDISESSATMKDRQFKALDPFGSTDTTTSSVPQAYNYISSDTVAKYYSHGDDAIATEMRPSPGHRLSNGPILENFLEIPATTSFGEERYSTTEELIRSFQQERTASLHETSSTNTTSIQPYVIPPSFHATPSYITTIPSHQFDNQEGRFSADIDDQDRKDFHGNMYRPLRFPSNVINNGFQEAMLMSYPFNLPQNATSLLQSSNGIINGREEEENNVLVNPALRFSPSDGMASNRHGNLAGQTCDLNSFPLRDHSLHWMNALMSRADTENWKETDASSFHLFKSPSMPRIIEEYSLQTGHSNALTNGNADMSVANEHSMMSSGARIEKLGLSRDFPMESSSGIVNSGTECSLQFTQASGNISPMSKYINTGNQISQSSHVKPMENIGTDVAIQSWVMESKGFAVATNIQKSNTSSPLDPQKPVTLSKSSAPLKPCGHAVVASAENSPLDDATIAHLPSKKKVSPKSHSEKQTSCKVISNSFGQRTSQYRGVTRHRWTGRYEAHLWDNSCKIEGQTRKGRQVYLGGYDKEDKAARAYDLAALKFWGPSSHINFPLSTYENELEEMKKMTRLEFVASLRRKSTGFSRGASIYRGVTRHHQQGRWQARIGRVAGSKDLYLGTYSTQEEAAEAYDIAAIKFRGPNTVTNFDISKYDVKSICCNSSFPGELVRRKVRKNGSQIEAEISCMPIGTDDYTPEWTFDDDGPCLDRAFTIKQNKERFPEAAMDGKASSLTASICGSFTANEHHDAGAVKIEKITTECTVSSIGSPTVQYTCEGSISQGTLEEARPPKKTKLISMLPDGNTSFTHTAVEKQLSDTSNGFSEEMISKVNEASSKHDVHENGQIRKSDDGPFCIMPAITESKVNDDNKDVPLIQKLIKVQEGHDSSSPSAMTTDIIGSGPLLQKPQDSSGEDSAKHTLILASGPEETESSSCKEGGDADRETWDVKRSSGNVELADHGMLPPQEEMRGSDHQIHGGVILPEAIVSDTHTEKPEEFTEIDTGLPHLEVVLKGEVTLEKSESDGNTMLEKPTNKNKLSQRGLMIY